MNLNTIINLGSLLVAFVSAFSAIINNKRDNKTIRDIESSKEELILENQKINHEQIITEKRNSVFIQFFISLNKFINEKTEENKKETIESCSQLLFYVNENEEEKSLVRGLNNNLQKYNLNSENEKKEKDINQLMKKTETQLLNIEKNRS